MTSNGQGGIQNLGGGPPAMLRNTIVAGTDGAAYDVVGSFSSLGNNLIGRKGANSFGLSHGVNADQVGSPSCADRRAVGALLALNGGSMFHARAVREQPCDRRRSPDELRELRPARPHAPRRLDRHRRVRGRAFGDRVLHRGHDDQRLRAVDLRRGTPSASLGSGFTITVSNVEGRSRD